MSQLGWTRPTATTHAERGLALHLGAVERSSSARVGDRALITADGELRGSGRRRVHGAGGGAAVVLVLSDGDLRRERIESRCASEGAVEVLIEPALGPFV
jgi:hypothetical protein